MRIRALFLGIITMLLFSQTGTAATAALQPPFSEGYLQVSPLHQVWYEEYGNPKGIPVVVLHGGPGAGCTDEMKFFDLNTWHVILLDQRGAKRSKPFAEIKENTTQDLISDIELLRKKLGIEKWVLFGGSWGSALAIAYGEAHPDHVLGFILRGVFLGTKAEVSHLWYGIRSTFPDTWQALYDFIPSSERTDLITAYVQRILGSNSRIALDAARVLMRYDFTCSFLQITPEKLNALLSDDTLVLGIAKIFSHYVSHNFFLEDNQLFENVYRIQHLPLIIVHGRYDMITLPKTAYALHKSWPGSELVFVTSGHAAEEPATKHALIEATEHMKTSVINSMKNGSVI
jgi:proline iminopeptidase